MKKRFLVVLLAVLMLCTGVLFAGCIKSPGNGTNTNKPSTPAKPSNYKRLTDAIVKNGERDSTNNSYSVLLNRGEELTSSLIYYQKDNSVQLVTLDSSSKVSMIIYITPGLSGIYNWSFKYDLYAHFGMGGTYYANRATATDDLSAYVEDVNKRTGGEKAEAYRLGLDAAKSMGWAAVAGLKTFLVFDTDLTMADLGFIRLK